MAKKESTKLAKAEAGTGIVLSADDAALAEVFGDASFDVDGLGAVDADDIKIAAVVWNMKGTDEEGDARVANRFYNTLTEQTVKTIRCAFLLLGKSLRNKVFDNDKNESILYCGSEDRVSGYVRTAHPDLGQPGDTPACGDCPQSKWRETPEGRKPPPCAVSYNVIAVDLDTNEPFVIRFTKTGLKPFKAHLQKHHINRLPLKGGGRAHVPLFAYEVTMSLVMSENGNYAIPVFDRGALLKDRLDDLGESAKGAAEYAGDALRVTENSDDHEGGNASGNAGGGAINASDFSD